MEQLLVTDSQLAGILGVSRATVWNMVRSGQIPKPVKLGRASRFDRAAVLACLGIAAPPAPPAAPRPTPAPPAPGVKRGRGRPRKVQPVQEVAAHE